MKRIFSYFLLLLSYIVYGQSNYTLSGFVSNQNNIPVKTGNVLLLDENSNLVKYALIIEGKFTFTHLNTNKYIATITSLGYNKESRTLFLDEDKILNIQLKKSVIALDEVTIKANKNNVTINNGNLKVTIKNSIFESLPSTIDILSKLPGIQINPNQESIFVVGKGSPLIYLDNQRISLDQLKSLSVEDIKDIELISNPSAKYEAQGRSLIFVTRKHNTIDGYKIQLSEIASIKKRFNNYLEVNSNYKKNKLELRSNFNYNQLGFWEGASSELALLENNIKSQYQVTATGPRPQYIIGSGIFYQFNKNDYISGQINLRAQTDKFPLKTNSILQQETREDHILTEVQNDEKRNFLSSNINFNKKINPSTSLFFGFQYSNYIRHPKSSIFNNFNKKGFELLQNRDQRYEISSFASKIDIEKRISKRVKLEIGGSISNANALAYSNFSFINPINTTISNYDYKESNYASYGQLSGNLNIIEYSMGMRLETNIVKGGFRSDNDLLINRKQTQYFPKIKINIPIDSTKSISFNYSKTIRRPHYLNASSISTFINPLVEFSRNVNLESTIIEEVSTIFQYKKSTLDINYYKENNPVFYDVIYDSLENRVISSPQNFEKESGYQIRFTNLASYKFWNSTNSLTLTHNSIKNSTAISNEAKPYLYYHSSNEFKLSSKTTLGLIFWGFTKRNQSVFKRNALFVANASFSKTYFNTLMVAINFNDIFKNFVYQDNFTSNNIAVQNNFYVDGREVSFTIKYSFGQTKKSSFRNKNIDPNLDRIQ
ncbi:outer membrane beta-barrel protein [Aquimarina sediminis]|uniref:outer membrane beta-barrel protein n=1 Tax=Aquimarina sediminis TaxID=2070536 RepID=UPI000CA08847|nr:outer membrane beta-barrel protein [Aquimarina sediminis]